LIKRPCINARIDPPLIAASLANVNGVVKLAEFYNMPGLLHFSICGVKSATPQISQKNGPNREKPAKMGRHDENPLHKWLRQETTTHPRNTARILKKTATPVRECRAGTFRVRDFSEKENGGAIQSWRRKFSEFWWITIR
jgi:hypothetical protein